MNPNLLCGDKTSSHRDEGRQGGSQGYPKMSGRKAPQFMGDESWTGNSPDISWHLTHVSPLMFSADRSASMSCRFSSRKVFFRVGSRCQLFLQGKRKQMVRSWRLLSSLPCALCSIFLSLSLCNLFFWVFIITRFSK